MLAQHQFVIHLVDVIACQNDHIFRRIGRDDIDVLMRIRRAFIPLVFGHAMQEGCRSFRCVPGRMKFTRCMCLISECALYCVATPMRRMPELIAFDEAKSMIRDFPPK